MNQSPEEPRPGLLQVTDSILLPEEELSFSFVRASGPGGQNVNKVATAVQLRFDITGSPSLPGEVKQRLLKLAGSRASNEGVMLIEAQRFRSQHRNREDAVDRLLQLIRLAAEKPKKRRKTRPSRSSVQRRLNAKQRRSKLKSNRRTPRPDRGDA